MNVDFNNLRLQACHQYDRLCRKLNNSIRKDVDTEWVDGYGDVRKGTIIIESDELQDVMDDLRSLIGTIAMVYREGEESFKDVYPKDKSLESFNPEDDD